MEKIEEYIYNGIEFPTEQEMYEYKRDKELEAEKELQAGKEDNVKELKKKESRFFIFCNIAGGGKLYFSKKGRYTFSLPDAYVGNEADVKKKLYFMNLNGTHKWRYDKI